MKSRLESMLWAGGKGGTDVRESGWRLFREAKTEKIRHAYVAQRTSLQLI